jgi:small subunit ribosomal protein S13
MTHLFGTFIPENKGLYISLTNIYGLGTKQVINICKSVGINPKISINKLTKRQKDTLSYIIESQHIIDSDLKKNNRENLQTLVEIQSFKGIRHFKGLPVRGQRTSTNSKTQKRLGSARLKRR